MTKQDKIERLIQTFNETRRSMSKGFDLKTNATKAQCNVMFEINKGAHRTSDLAKILQTSPSAVTQLVNQLVDDGYVLRSDSLADRREVQLELTDKAREILKQMHQFAHTRAVDIATVLTDSELENYISISHKIAQYINNKQEG